MWVTPKVELDMTPVNVVQFSFDLKPKVGEDSHKIGVTVTLRLLYQSDVS